MPAMTGLSLVLEPPAMEARPDAAPDAFPAEAMPPEPGAPNGVHLWAARPSFESSMLLLGWADMLLKSAGSREAVATLAHYYHNIGWIGDPARDQLLAYAEGIAAPENGAGDADWRAVTDVHERSLLFIEKLKAAASRRSA
jgi:archaellum component FlaD/FlaE